MRAYCALCGGTDPAQWAASEREVDDRSEIRRDATPCLEPRYRCGSWATGQLGGWLDRPTEAGHAARRLAVAMSATHLASGYDVVVPQFLGRPEFIELVERRPAVKLVDVVRGDIDRTFERFTQAIAAEAS